VKLASRKNVVAKKKPKKLKKAKVTVEYEMETEEQAPTRQRVKN
jgi:hypothetical protein